MPNCVVFLDYFHSYTCFICMFLHGTYMYNSFPNRSNCQCVGFNIWMQKNRHIWGYTSVNCFLPLHVVTKCTGNDSLVWITGW